MARVHKKTEVGVRCTLQSGYSELEGKLVNGSQLMNEAVGLSLAILAAAFK